MTCFKRILYIPLLISTSLSLNAATTVFPRASAGDWHQWMGPNRDSKSTETGLLSSWPEGGPRLVWKGTGLGAGFSTVSKVGQRLYSMGDINDKSSVVAINAADGKLIWTTPIGRAGAPGWGGFTGPRATPTVDGDLLFVICQYGELACLNATTGKVVWQKHLTDDFGGSRAEWGFAESPMVVGGKLLCTPGGGKGAIIALNKKTGETIWQSKEFTDKAAYASLVRCAIGGVDQVVQLTAASVAGVAIDDGRLLWRADRKGRTAVVPTPVVSGNRVYVSSGYRVGCNLFEISAKDGKFQAKEVYANTNMVNHHGGVLLHKGHLYGYSDGKGWVCQNLQSGEIVWREKEISWGENENKKKLGKGSLVYADGHLYCRYESGPGTIALIEATPEGFKDKGHFIQPDRSKPRSWPHPVVAGGRLYIRDQDILLCYDIKAK